MKKFTFLLFIFLCSNSYSQIPTDSLVAYYPLNVNANDSSGNGYNGTLGGQTPEPGMCSGAYKFLNDFIDCGDPLNDAFDLVNDATISL